MAGTKCFRFITLVNYHNTLQLSFIISFLNMKAESEKQEPKAFRNWQVGSEPKSVRFQSPCDSHGRSLTKLLESYYCCLPCSSDTARKW